MSRISHWYMTFRSDAHAKVFLDSTDDSKAVAFKNYRLQLDVEDKSSSFQARTSYMMIIGVERLWELCHSISQYSMLRELFYDIRFLQTDKVSSLVWSEERLLAPFVHPSTALSQSTKRFGLELFYGWWDFPHLVMHGALDTDLAAKAIQKIMTGIWRSAPDFINFFISRYQESRDLRNQHDLEAAIMLMMHLGLLIRKVRVSRQARSFRKGRHKEVTQLALSFFSFACPMTTSGIALMLARKGSHHLGSSLEMAQTVVEMTPQVKAAIVSYVDLSPNTKRKLSGVISLQEAEACGILGDEARMRVLHVDAHDSLGAEYDSYVEYVRGGVLRFEPPPSLLKVD